MTPAEYTPDGMMVPRSPGSEVFWRAYSGDTMSIRAGLTDADGEPVVPETHDVRFVLSDQMFTPADAALWTGDWDDGISEVDPSEHPGLVDIVIPQELSDLLTRGSYRFSLRVERKYDNRVETAMIGHLIVEYVPHSPHHRIPYKGLYGEAGLGSAGAYMNVNSTPLYVRTADGGRRTTMPTFDPNGEEAT